MGTRIQMPAATHAVATHRATAQSGRLVLLGTMHGPSVGRALFRYLGKTHVLEVGDTLDGATVVAIGEAVVVLRRGGRTERLTLPDTGDRR